MPDLPPLIWDASDLPAVVAALPPTDAPPGTRGQRAAHAQHRLLVAEQVVALRDASQTWAEVGRVVGLSPSRVRALYAEHAGGAERPDDAAILANVRQFVAECERGKGRPSRRAYGAWPGRLVAPATVEGRFGTWTQALERAR